MSKSKYEAEMLAVIGKNIREARIRKGYRQREIAEKLDMDYQHYNCYELGKHEMRIFMFARIAKTLGVSMDSLFEGVR